MYATFLPCMLACQKRAPDLIIDGCEPPCACWELNSGSLEEQSVLLASEPSLQPSDPYLIPSVLSGIDCSSYSFCSHGASRPNPEFPVSAVHSHSKSLSPASRVPQSLLQTLVLTVQICLFTLTGQGHLGG